jgi:hypothetical protein
LYSSRSSKLREEHASCLSWEILVNYWTVVSSLSCLYAILSESSDLELVIHVGCNRPYASFSGHEFGQLVPPSASFSPNLVSIWCTYTSLFIMEPYGCPLCTTSSRRSMILSSFEDRKCSDLMIVYTHYLDVVPISRISNAIY